MHAHSALLLGVPTAKIASQLGLPFVITEHQSSVALASLSESQKANIKGAVGMANGAVAVSHALAERVRAISQCDSVRVIPNMVDTGFFSPPTAPPDLTSFKILSVGWLVRGKRLDVLLRAFAICFRERQQVVLEIGGSGPELAALQRLASQLAIERQVVFLGELGRDAVLFHMHRANLFVLPSSYETFGVVLIEAMATGLPVIATSSGGPKEIVTELGGRLVSPDNVSEFAGALADEFALRERRAKQRLEIHRDIKQRYSKEVVVEMLENWYAEALASARS